MSRRSTMIATGAIVAATVVGTMLYSRRRKGTHADLGESALMLTAAFPRLTAENEAQTRQRVPL